MRATREMVRVDRSGEGGEEDVPRVGRDVTGQECMTGCRRGIPLCGKSSLLTLNRLRVGQLFRGNSHERLAVVRRRRRISQKCRDLERGAVFDYFGSIRMRYQLRSHRTFRRNHRGNHLVSQQFRPFGVPKGREGLRELQTRAFCEKSYAHSVPKKPENVDSRLVLTGKIASDRTLALFPKCRVRTRKVSALNEVARARNGVGTRPIATFCARPRKRNKKKVVLVVRNRMACFFQQRNASP